MAEVKYNRVKIILVEFDISQLEFAEIMNVDKNTVTRWCKNHNQPSLPQLRDMAEFFRIDVRLLIEPTNWNEKKGPSPIELYKEKRKKSKQETSKAKKNINRSK